MVKEKHTTQNAYSFEGVLQQHNQFVCQILVMASELRIDSAKKALLIVVDPFFTDRCLDHQLHYIQLRDRIPAFNTQRVILRGILQEYEPKSDNPRNKTDNK